MKLQLLLSSLLTTVALSSQAAEVLSSDLTGVERSGNTATIDSWDVVSGIDAPSTSLDFYQGGTLTAVSFFNVADEIAVNRNMTDGGWDTSISFQLDSSTSTLTLDQLVLNMRLSTGNGSDNTTGNKSGSMSVVLTGSASGLLGTVDPGFSNYPGVTYSRSLDLSALPELNDAESYTLTIQARGTGFGHHKALQGLELTAVPEPSAVFFGLTGLGLLLLRRLR